MRPCALLVGDGGLLISKPFMRKMLLAKLWTSLNTMRQKTCTSNHCAVSANALGVSIFPHFSVSLPNLILLANPPKELHRGVQKKNNESEREEGR